MSFLLSARRCLCSILLLLLRRKSGAAGGTHFSPSILYFLHSGASLLPPFFFLRAGAALDDGPVAPSSLRRFAPSTDSRNRYIAALSEFLFQALKPRVDGFLGFAGVDLPAWMASS